MALATTAEMVALAEAVARAETAETATLMVVVEALEAEAMAETAALMVAEAETAETAALMVVMVVHQPGQHMQEIVGRLFLTNW